MREHVRAASHLVQPALAEFLLGGTKPTAWAATVRAGNAYLLEELRPSEEQDPYKLTFERQVSTFDTLGLWVLGVFFYAPDGKTAAYQNMVSDDDAPMVAIGDYVLRVAYELTVHDCPACSGSGTFVWTQMGREYTETCLNCEGTGKVMNDE